MINFDLKGVCPSLCSGICNLAPLVLSTILQDFRLNTANLSSAWSFTQSNNQLIQSYMDSPFCAVSYAFSGDNVVVSLPQDPRVSSNEPSKSSPIQSNSSNAGIIVGGIIGVIILIVLITLGVYWYRNRQAQNRLLKKMEDHSKPSVPMILSYPTSH